MQVNISGKSIGDRTLLAYIEGCVARSGADPSTMVFELTETAVTEDEAAGELFARGIRDLGCELALDDFGTGYGGFTYLKRLPINYLKIDVEFVRDIASSASSHRVVQGVVALAHAFRIQTVGEGVEDAETLQILRLIGVDFAQGYHIGRPAPVAGGGQSERAQER